jgi:hypothetical protein
MEAQDPDNSGSETAQAATEMHAAGADSIFHDPKEERSIRYVIE